MKATSILLVLVLLVTAISIMARFDGGPIHAYRGEKRVLLIYIPDTTPARENLQELETNIAEWAGEMQSRDVVMMHIGPVPSEAKAYAEPLSEGQKAALVRRFIINNAVARLVLVGKDGNVIARQAQDRFSLERLFSLIDAMDRQGEMREAAR